MVFKVAVGGSHDPGTGHDCRLHLWPAEVQVAVLQLQLFGGIDVIFNRKWWRLGLVQNLNGVDFHLNFARLQVTVDFLFAAALNFTGHGDDVFATQRVGNRERIRVERGRKDQLHEAGTVAQINKNQVTQAASLPYPAHQRDGLAKVGGRDVTRIHCTFIH